MLIPPAVGTVPITSEDILFLCFAEFEASSVTVICDILFTEQVHVRNAITHMIVVLLGDGHRVIVSGLHLQLSVPLEVGE